MFDVKEFEKKIVDKTAYSKSRIPSSATNGKQYVVVHYNGANAKEPYCIGSDGAGGHYYVWMDGTIVQAVYDNKVIWHVGTAGYYTQLHPYARNANSIGIEMATWNKVNNKTVNEYWELTEEEQEATAQLCAYLLTLYNLGIDRLLRHGDVVNKDCPAMYTAYNGKSAIPTVWTWEKFKKRVQDIMSGADMPKSEGKQNEGRIYRVYDENKQVGAYSVPENASNHFVKLAKDGHDASVKTAEI